MDDVTLGKLFTEAHRGQADYCEPEGVSVSQSSSVVFDGSGKPDGERNVDHQLVLVSQETRTVLTASFLKTPKLRKWSIEQGNLMSEKTAQAHRLGLYLDEQRQMIIAEYREKIGHHELQAAQAEEERRLLQGQNYDNRNWNFVKLINKVLQRWRNYENSRVLPSILSRDENLSRIRTLFWNYQAEYRNCTK